MAQNLFPWDFWNLKLFSCCLIYMIFLRVWVHCGFPSISIFWSFCPDPRNFVRICFTIGICNQDFQFHHESVLLVDSSVIFISENLQCYSLNTISVFFFFSSSPGMFTVHMLEFLHQSFNSTTNSLIFILLNSNISDIFFFGLWLFCFISTLYCIFSGNTSPLCILNLISVLGWVSSAVHALISFMNLVNSCFHIVLYLVHSYLDIESLFFIL